MNFYLLINVVLSHMMVTTNTQVSIRVVLIVHVLMFSSYPNFLEY